MATIKKGITSHFTGKIGGVVGTTWRGIAVVKTAPKKSTKKPSVAQLLQRAKFSTVVAFLQPIKPFLMAHFGKMEDSKAPFDFAISYHLKNAIKVEDDMLVIDYPKVCISKGHLKGLDGASATVTAANVLTLQWTDNSNQSFTNPDDRLNIVLFIPSMELFYFFENSAMRHDQSVQLPLPEATVGAEVHCWATFVSFTGLQAATSSYILMANE